MVGLFLSLLKIAGNMANNGGRGMSKGDLARFEEAWTENMKNYWAERMELLGAVSTGRLKGSLRGQQTVSAGGTRMLTHQFLKYGIYVAAGAGPEGKRKPKEWFFNAYERSIKKLMEVESEALADEYVGITFSTLRSIFDRTNEKHR